MFGISFGSNKTKQTQSTNQTQTGTQATTGTNTTNTTGTQTQSGTSATTSTGTQSNTSNQQTNQTGTQQTTGTTSNFDAQTLAALGGGIGDFISKLLTNPAGSTATDLGSFDADQFVSDQLKAATSLAQTSLTSGTNQIITDNGGDASQSSMAALLQNVLTNQTESNLAGVRAQATQTAQGILANRAQTESAATASGSNALAAVLNAIKGGTQTTTGSATTATTGATTGTGTTTTNQAQNTSSNQTTTTAQQVAEIIDQIVNSNQTLTGTTTGNTKNSGGGFSLGL